MSKHIIELRPDCKIVQQICEKDGQIYMGSTGIHYLEEFTVDYIQKNCKSLLDAFYQKGFDEGKAVNDKGCEGCKYQSNRELTCPCSECANNFKNQWTVKSPIDDGFVRGDVVVDERDGTRGIVVSSENNESNLLYVLFKGYRVPQSVVRKYYKKTGEHYDIDKFLN